MAMVWERLRLGDVNKFQSNFVITLLFKTVILIELQTIIVRYSFVVLTELRRLVEQMPGSKIECKYGLMNHHTEATKGT